MNETIIQVGDYTIQVQRADVLTGRRFQIAGRIARVILASAEGFAPRGAWVIAAAIVGLDADDTGMIDSVAHHARKGGAR